MKQKLKNLEQDQINTLNNLICEYTEYLSQEFSISIMDLNYDTILKYLDDESNKYIYLFMS